MSAANILATLQGHQLVIERELVEINADLQSLNDMCVRYAQANISLGYALEQLTRLRNEKEVQLLQVTKQAQTMEASYHSSALLVSELQRPGGLSQMYAVPALSGLGLGTQGLPVGPPSANSNHRGGSPQMQGSAYPGSGFAAQAHHGASPSAHATRPISPPVRSASAANGERQPPLVSPRSLSSHPYAGGNVLTTAREFVPPQTVSTLTTDASTFGVARPMAPLVTLTNPQGLVVTTNSSILTHSPQRNRY